MKNYNEFVNSLLNEDYYKAYKKGGNIQSLIKTKKDLEQAYKSIRSRVGAKAVTLDKSGKIWKLYAVEPALDEKYLIAKA